MILNQDGINLMHQYEGLRLNAYLCPAGIPTIGYGNTFYEDGTKVKIGDFITQDEAVDLFENIVDIYFANPIRKLLKKTLNSNQFSALVCFAYNVGMANLRKSTLLRKVNANPNDATIRNEFLRWVNKGSAFEKGLTRRRIAEANLYFK